MPRVLYRDEHLLAVDKPSGLLVHRGWDSDPVTLVDLVREMLGAGKVHPLHRIDRGASGIVLFALDPGVAADMREPFEHGGVEKRYLALVRGVVHGKGVIDHPIPRREGGPRVDSATEYGVLITAATEPRHVSLVEARPLTGRLHQVRRHLKHIDHPVIGDANYGKGDLNRALADRYGIRRLALHASRLSFEHPRTRERVVIASNLPPDLHTPFASMFGEDKLASVDLG